MVQTKIGLQLERKRRDSQINSNVTLFRKGTEYTEKTLVGT